MDRFAKVNGYGFEGADRIDQAWFNLSKVWLDHRAEADNISNEVAERLRTRQIHPAHYNTHLERAWAGRLPLLSEATLEVRRSLHKLVGRSIKWCELQGPMTPEDEVSTLTGIVDGTITVADNMIYSNREGYVLKSTAGPEGIFAEDVGAWLEITPDSKLNVGTNESFRRMFGIVVEDVPFRAGELRKRA